MPNKWKEKESNQLESLHCRTVVLALLFHGSERLLTLSPADPWAQLPEIRVQ